MTDQVDILGVVGFRNGIKELGGTGIGNGAQVFDQIFLVHPDPVIGNRQNITDIICQKAHLEIGITSEQIRFGNRFIAQLVARIRGVGDQLAQEDVLVGIKRVDNDIEQSANLSLEPHFFFRHDLFFLLCFKRLSASSDIGRRTDTLTG